MGGAAVPVTGLAEVPAAALAIGAHPADVEFGCGATLARWAAAGCIVHHLVCTDGSKGTWDPAVDPAVLVALRRDEQRAAARALGATGEVVFLGWPDGELESGLRQRWEVAHAIRRLRPTVLLGHDPWRRYRLHPDHRHAGFLACDGIVAARDPLFFPEQHLEPWRPRTLLLWEADDVDHYEDVTGHTDAKLAALLAHASQHRSTMGIDAADPAAAIAAEADFRTRVLDRLAICGLAVGVAHAEAFKRIDDL
ncbi:MAG: PIG-L family deacetylase [Acidimicrobiia bacterium]|nr:PIG-L family deacetylase [Acidimicrobiia bacterium]